MAPILNPCLHLCTPVLLLLTVIPSPHPCSLVPACCSSAPAVTLIWAGAGSMEPILWCLVQGSCRYCRVRAGVGGRGKYQGTQEPWEGHVQGTLAQGDQKWEGDQLVVMGGMGDGRQGTGVLLFEFLTTCPCGAVFHAVVVRGWGGDDLR